MEGKTYRAALGYNPRRDQVVHVVTVGLLLFVAMLLLMLLRDIPLRGLPRVTLEFLQEFPRSGGRKGGIYPVLISTLWLLGMATMAAVPLGIGAATFLSEWLPRKSSFRSYAHAVLEMLATIPSVAFGLFGNAIFCHWFSLGYSVLSGALTVAIMIFPVIVAGFEQAFRSVPLEFRQQAEALNFSRRRTFVSVVLPWSLPALCTTLVLGVGRVVAETAAVLFTSGYSTRLPESVLDPGRVLAVHIYDLAMNVIGGEPVAFASAAVLVISMIVINGFFSLIKRLLLSRTGG